MQDKKCNFSFVLALVFSSSDKPKRNKEYEGLRHQLGVESMTRGRGKQDMQLRGKFSENWEKQNCCL